MTFLLVLHLCAEKKVGKHGKIGTFSYLSLLPCISPSIMVLCTPAAIMFELANPTVSLAWSFSPTVLLIIDAFSLFKMSDSVYV